MRLEMSSDLKRRNAEVADLNPAHCLVSGSKYRLSLLYRKRRSQYINRINIFVMAEAVEIVSSWLISRISISVRNRLLSEKAISRLICLKIFIQ